MIEATIEHIQQRVNITKQRIEQLQRERADKQLAIQVIQQTIRTAETELGWYEKVLAFAQKERE